MTAELGTNVDKLGESISADDLHWLNARWARVVAAPDRVMDQLAYVRAMKQVGSRVLMDFDADAYRHFGPLDDPVTWRQAANWGKAVYGGLIDAVEPTNEPDDTGVESSHMSPSTVNGVLEAHARSWGTDMTIVGCGTSTGQVGWYSDNGIRIDLVDALSFHPYAKFNPADLTRILDEHASMGLPLWVTEVGLDTNDSAQAEFLTWTLNTIKDHSAVQVCTWFCGHAYGYWGLKRDDGTWRPSAEAFREIAAVPPPAQFVLGFKKWHDLEPALIGDALANERNTGFHGWQIQPTSLGVLQWHENDGHIFVTRDGRVYRWTEDLTSSIEVFA